MVICREQGEHSNRSIHIYRSCLWTGSLVSFPSFALIVISADTSWRTLLASTPDRRCGLEEFQRLPLHVHGLIAGRAATLDRSVDLLVGWGTTFRVWDIHAFAGVAFHDHSAAGDGPGIYACLAGPWSDTVGVAWVISSRTSVGSYGGSACSVVVGGGRVHVITMSGQSLVIV